MYATPRPARSISEPIQMRWPIHIGIPSQEINE